MTVTVFAADAATSMTYTFQLVRASSLSYQWNWGDWSQCLSTSGTVVTCGSGTQTRTVNCRASDNSIAADSQCEALYGSASRPVSSQPCTGESCGNYLWQRDVSKECSCDTGVVEYTVFCYQGSDPSKTPIHDNFCAATPKPGTSATCTPPENCTRWYLGGWSPSACPTPCTPGTTQTRQVFCTNSNYAFLPPSDCTGAQPSTSQACC
jgi:hypothetical protein